MACITLEEERRWYLEKFLWSIGCTDTELM